MPASAASRRACPCGACSGSPACRSSAFIRLPSYAIRHAGAVVSEGDAIHARRHGAAAVRRGRDRRQGRRDLGRHQRRLRDEVPVLRRRQRRADWIGRSARRDRHAARTACSTASTGGLTAQSFRSDEDLEDRALVLSALRVPRRRRRGRRRCSRSCTTWRQARSCRSRTPTRAWRSSRRSTRSPPTTTSSSTTSGSSASRPTARARCRATRPRR